MTGANEPEGIGNSKLPLTLSSRSFARRLTAFKGILVKVNRRSAGMSCAYPPRLGRLPHSLYFYERPKMGASFHIEAGKYGQFPSEEAASLLAMHCMVRGLSPNDFAVLVPIDEQQLKDFYERTARLLQVGRSLKNRIRITRREEQVLSKLQNNLSNKEIAHALNLSVRTVKFHVSSLLAKFRVRNRLELLSQAWRYFAHTDPDLFPADPPMGRPFASTRSEANKHIPSSRQLT